MSDRIDACRPALHRCIDADSTRPDAATCRSGFRPGGFELNPRHALAAWLAGSMFGALLILALAGGAAFALRLIG